MADTFLVIGTGPTVNLVLSGVGASAYTIWLEAGNTGTEQDFLDSLEGAQGPAGATGATGPQGDPGFVSLNGLTNPTQTFATGTSGADFAISSSGTTHTFNLPNASTNNRGLLLAMDWTTFNNKIGGSGTAGGIARFSAAGAITSDTNHVWDGTNTRVKINTTTPVYIGGISGAGNFPGIWFTTSTPSLTNYSVLNDSGDLLLNTVTAKGIVFRQNNNTWATQRGAVLALSGGVTSTGALGETAEYVISSGSNIYSMDMSGAEPFIAMSNGTVKVFGGHASNTDGAVFGAFSNHGLALRAGGNVNRLKMDASGNTSIGDNVTPTSKLDVTGANGYSQLRLRTKYTPTGTADALGNVGDFAWDDNYTYVKTSAGWKRSALSAF